MSNKLVNIKAIKNIWDSKGEELIQQSGTIIRTTRVLAEKYVTQGTHRFTVKKKLKGKKSKSVFK